MHKIRSVLITTIVLTALLFAAGVSKILASSPDYANSACSPLAIGVPHKDLSGVGDAGELHFQDCQFGYLYSPDSWSQNDLSGSNPEIQDYFGDALAMGDFNGDGYLDIAVGVPGEDIGSSPEKADAGAVNVIYGTADGLSSTNSQYWNQDWHQGDLYMGGTAEIGDHFGAALAAGDFNQDGYDDLAIGIPDESSEAHGTSFGTMMVLNGSAIGLTASTKIWSRGTQAEEYERFAYALAAGDFNDDGYDDLAVGIPGDNLGGAEKAGAVQLYYGSNGGLQSILDNYWSQFRPEVTDEPEDNDMFGWSLTTGDFDGDGYDDLAIGVPYEDITSTVTITDAGAVNVLYGTDNGIGFTGEQFWHQKIGSIQSICEENDRFGYTLTAGDFNGDGYFELVVGVPFEDWLESDTGIIQVLFGTSGGLTDANNQLWRQGNLSPSVTEEAGDEFGYAVAAGNFNGDLYDDLSIGAPFRDDGASTDSGMIYYLSGGVDGLTGYANYGSSGDSYDRIGEVLASYPNARKLIYLPFTVK